MKKICIALTVLIFMLSANIGVYADISAQSAESDNTAAVAEAAEHFSAGITANGDLKEYTASNGVKVSLEWSNIYDNTIADENGSYLNTTYLSADGSVTVPQWYEGKKKLKASLTLTAGGETQTVSSSVVIEPQTAPDFSDAYKRGLLTDYIDIGNKESEIVNGVKRLESVRDNGEETKEIDGITHTYRTLNKNGAMAVTMKCDPDKINYFTVKLWGSDTGDTMLWLCDPVTGYMNISNSRQPSRDGVVDRRDWVELNFLNSSPQYDGGFIYSTYMIPEIYTKGREYVSLRIYSTGGNANYSTVKIKDQTMPSRGIYAAYMTQKADFDPSDFEEITGGFVNAEESRTVDYGTQKKFAEQYAKNAVKTFKSWQIYGQDNYPSYMEGMVTRGTDWSKKKLTDDNWKNAYYSKMMQQNLTPLNMYELFSYAYINADTLGYDSDEKAELLDRTVKGIDFLVRAQGADGGFYSEKNWIGGPERVKSSSHHLTGFGLRSVAQAMVMISGAAEEKGYFAGMIDSNADGNADMMRKSAWENMAAAARDFLVSLDGAGHAPNQDMADIIAALRFEKALQILNSPLSWKALDCEDNIEKYLDIALGFSINKACSSYWVSPKGLILENFGSIQGGYSGDYGIEALEEMSQLTEFAEEYYKDTPEKAEKYINRMKDAYDASDKFMFTANAELGGKPTLYAEGLTGNRNAYYPGSERYILDEYNALEKKNKTALKTFEKFFIHNKLQLDRDVYYASNSHFEDNALAVMKLYLNFDRIVSAIEDENISEYNYLMEDDNVSLSAWADEMGRNVVIKNGNDKIYLALNWRNPLRSINYYNTETVTNEQRGLMNNLARVHHTTDKYDKYGYAAMKTVGWNVQTADKSNWQLFSNHYVDAFMYMNYGDYAVIMNSNNLLGNENNVEYDIPADELALDGLYKELISGEIYYFGDKVAGAEDGGTVKVKPASTLVLYKIDSIDQPDPTTKPTPTETPTPSPTPTPVPTPSPTETPTVSPTVMPTPTTSPTATPTVSPTESPTTEPTTTPITTDSPTPPPIIEPSLTPTDSPNPPPTTEPTPDATPDNISTEIKVKDAEYKDGIVKVEFSGKTEDGAEVYIYAAEYDKNGSLIGVGLKITNITGSSAAEFDYEQKNTGNTVKIYVWDKNMTPYKWEQN